MSQKLWDVTQGTGPVIATAIHDGHQVRDNLSGLFSIGDSDRLREEDPYTGRWARTAPTWVVGLRSRFEVDLNRPRERAVYVTPDDAWGLEVWKRSPPAPEVAESLAEYDLFYEAMHRLFSTKALEHERFVVLDIHSYNHRRTGPEGEPADPAGNPQVNIGTGTMRRDPWASLVDRFIGDLRAFDFPGGQLDVRENIKFFGGNLARWTHENFPARACVLSIEFKKFFMDEWTGEPNSELVEAIGEALTATLPGLHDSLNSMSASQDA